MAAKSSEQQDIKKGMPKAMSSLYDDFYGNTERLKSEWQLCTQQYKTAMEQAMSEQGTVYHRLTIRKITDYWKKRRNALEAALPEDVVEQFRKVEEL